MRWPRSRRTVDRRPQRRAHGVALAGRARSPYLAWEPALPGRCSRVEHRRALGAAPLAGDSHHQHARRRIRSGDFARRQVAGVLLEHQGSNRPHGEVPRQRRDAESDGLAAARAAGAHRTSAAWRSRPTERQISFAARIDPQLAGSTTRGRFPGPVGGVPRKLLAGIPAMQWSPTGGRSRTACRDRLAAICWWLRRTTAPASGSLVEREGGRHIHWFAWSRDGQYLYFICDLRHVAHEPSATWRVPVKGGPAEAVLRYCAAHDLSRTASIGRADLRRQSQHPRPRTVVARAKRRRTDGADQRSG